MSLKNTTDYNSHALLMAAIKTPTPSGFQTITFSAATVYSLTVPEGSTYAVMQVMAVGGITTDLIRAREDGTDPTTTVGLSYAPTEKWSVVGAEALRRWRGIRTTANAHILSVQYYK